MSAYSLAARSAARRIVVAPSDLVVRTGFYIIIVMVLSALWGAAAEANGGAVAGYTSFALTWYMIFSECAVNAIRPRLIEDIGIDIDSGGVAIEMLRPVSVVLFRIATEIGESLSRFVIMLAIGAALGVALAGSPPDAATFLLAIPSGLLAVACSVSAQHLFAAMSFWQGEAKGAWFLYLKLVFILGGMLLPLEVLPGWLETTSKILPFWTMAYAPARLAAGFNEPLLLFGQASWLLALTALAVAAFAAGEKRVQTGVG
jgi:ABC-2 type transport system permease protein